MSGVFLDNVSIDVAAGRGGRGAVSFRREKYVPNGGPDGGDGGRGGSVIFVADSDDTTLGVFRERRRFQAAPGGDGARSQRHGKDADNLELHVPAGTVVRDAANGEVMADLDQRGARVVVAAGGRGGRGNSRFATSTRQAPRIGELGGSGVERRLDLELKLIADIGLVGLPNAGKSTLLAALTGAHPKIAAYPFTTLHPNLGVAEVDHGRTMVIADVPGLIEGAHLGIGLGIDFLRHLERTRVLIHVVDASQGAEAAGQAIQAVEAELAAFSLNLAAKPVLYAFNKLDVPEAVITADHLASEYQANRIVAAAADDACRVLLDAAAARVFEVRRAEALGELPDAQVVESPTHRVYTHVAKRRREDPVIVRESDVYRVVHPATEKLVDITDMDNEEALARLQRRMRVAGIDAALADAGCREGDTVRIGEVEFAYSDDYSHPTDRP